MLPKQVSVIVPAYNEAGCINRNVRAIIGALSSHVLDLEIIVVDDGSVDETWRALANTPEHERGVIRILRCDRNQGKGFALACGAQRARGEVVVFLDADLDLHPDQIPSFFDILIERDADAVIGSKWHPASNVDYPRSRKFLSRGYYAFVRLLFGLPLRDTQTGLKVFRASMLHQVLPLLLTKRFAFDIELLAVAHRMGFRIVEAPVTLRFNREFPRLRMGEAWNVLLDTLAIFYRIYFRRHYDRPRITEVLSRPSDTAPAAAREP